MHPRLQRKKGLQRVQHDGSRKSCSNVNNIAYDEATLGTTNMAVDMHML